MKRLGTLILAAGLLLGVSGCGTTNRILPASALLRYTTFTDEQMRNLDFGPCPKDYKKIVRGWLDLSLKDPDSAKVEFIGEPRKALQEANFPHLPIYGWGGYVSVNAKNGFGAYTGATIEEYLIWNGELVKYGNTTVKNANQPIPMGGIKDFPGAKNPDLRFF